MAMLIERFLSTADVQDAFFSATGKGSRYLLSLTETTDSEWRIESNSFLREAASANDIVNVLQGLSQSRFPGLSQSLDRIIDLSRRQDDQPQDEIRAALPENVRLAIQAFCDATGGQASGQPLMAAACDRV